MDIRISAGIILYYPQKERLFQNIENISQDVENLYIYNNGCDKDILKELSSYNEKIHLLGDGNNVGIATAMNEIMKQGEKNKDEWLVTFDQDSVSDVNLINAFRQNIDHPEAAILCPQVIDIRRKYMEAEQSDKIVSVDRCITSASCTRVSAWKQIGGFDDFLFIDLVDNDFCKRLKLAGWDILKLYSVVLNQEFGNIELKSEKKVKRIMKVSDFVKTKLKMKTLANNIAKLSYKKIVSPLRVYYSNRNIIYLNKKFSKYGGIGYDCYSCHTYFGFQICFNLASVLRGKHKIKIIKAIIKGKKDGRKAKVDPV